MGDGQEGSLEALQAKQAAAEVKATTTATKNNNKDDGDGSGEMQKSCVEERPQKITESPKRI